MREAVPQKEKRDREIRAAEREAGPEIRAAEREAGPEIRAAEREAGPEIRAAGERRTGTEEGGIHVSRQK